VYISFSPDNKLLQGTIRQVVTIIGPSTTNNKRRISRAAITSLLPAALPFDFGQLPDLETPPESPTHTFSLRPCHRPFSSGLDLGVNPTTSAGDDRWLRLEKDTHIRQLDGWKDLPPHPLSTTYFLDLLLLVVRKQVSGSQILLTATVKTRKLYLL
jgi:hypothetical protein